MFNQQKRDYYIVNANVSMSPTRGNNKSPTQNYKNTEDDHMNENSVGMQQYSVDDKYRSMDRS
jgi:hypothetical protein